MVDAAAAQILADELNAQARTHPRVMMLFIPRAEIEGGEVVIRIEWLDRQKSEVPGDAVIRFAAYEGQRTEEAAKQILDHCTTCETGGSAGGPL